MIATIGSVNIHHPIWIKWKEKGKDISPCNENARIYSLSFPIYYSTVLATVIIMYIISVIVIVQLPSHVRLLATTWTAAHQASLPLIISWRLSKFMLIASVMPSSHLILWYPLLLLPSKFPSTRDFSNESAVHIIWPKYWSFNFSISPSNECSGLISLKIDWFELLSFQGTFMSLLRHHSLKASILWRSAFFMVQVSHPYMTTRKTIAFPCSLSMEFFR